MTPWLAFAAALLLVGLAPAVVAAGRRGTMDRLAGLALAGTVAPLVLLELSAGYRRTSYLDTALVLAALSLTGSLVFARLVARR